MPIRPCLFPPTGIIGELAYLHVNISPANTYQDELGWIWLNPNGLTIGKTASGATVSRDDLYRLFEKLWADRTLSLLSNSGTELERTTARQDWDRGKLKTPNLVGRSLFNANPAGANGLSVRTLSQAGGQENVALSEAQMAPHIHPANSQVIGNHGHPTFTDSQGYHGHNITVVGVGNHAHTIASRADAPGFGAQSALTRPRGGGTTSDLSTGADGGAHTHPAFSDAQGSHGHNVTMQASGEHSHIISIGVIGGGQGHPNMPPFAVESLLLFSGVRF